MEKVLCIRTMRSTRRAAMTLSKEQTELETWFERDRAHVELRNAQTDSTILEFGTKTFTS